MVRLAWRLNRVRMRVECVRSSVALRHRQIRSIQRSRQPLRLSPDLPRKHAEMNDLHAAARQARNGLKVPESICLDPLALAGLPSQSRSVTSWPAYGSNSWPSPLIFDP